MASLIKRLPEALASQIAAGEVVQHPASVVKELVENALDAGATRVRVFLQDAGKALVQVVDDGQGMSPEDAMLCFERHATSKISVVEDLFAIRTLGFRGEALAAIGSVAKVSLKTRQTGEEIGHTVTVDAGVVQQPEPTATAEGTSIAVSHLFYNVPARRHFLRSNPAEIRRIVDEFQRLALANPEVAFELDHNGLEMFRLPAANQRQRVVAVLGRRSNERLVPVEESTPLLHLHGFIGKPEGARKTRGEQFFFFNGRFFRSSYLNHAVVQAFEGLLPEKHHPLYVLFLEMDPSRVDVNVHPTKQEIKFEDEKIVYAYIQAAVRHALSRYSATPTLDFDQDPDFSDLAALRKPQDSSGVEQPEPVAKTSGRFGQGGDFGAGSDASADSAGGRSQTGGFGSSSKSHPGSGSGPFRETAGAAPMKKVGGAQPWESLYTVLADERKGAAEEEAGLGMADPAAAGFSPEGQQMLTLPGGEDDSAASQPVQLHGRYVLWPIKSGFLLLDQRAAHERILYEKYRGRLAAEAGMVQRQLFPETLDLSPADAITLRELLPAVNALGFDLQAGQDDTFVVHGTPADCAEMDDRLAVDELLAAFRRLGDIGELKPRERVARSLARSYAMPPGRVLDATAMRDLVDRLFACETPYAAPDGQATFLTFTLDELAARFRKR